MHDLLWGIVNRMETAPSKEEVDHHSKFLVRRERALATIVLAVELSLLCLIGDPEDPVVVWKKLLRKKWENKLASPPTETSLLTTERR